MSVKQSVNWLSQQRVDVPDLRALESGVIFDFKTMVQCFVGSIPYILRGFTIPVSGISGPATSLQLVVDSSVVWSPSELNGSFLRVESGTANEVLSTANPKVFGSFSPGTNYVGIRFTRATDPTTADLVSLWDVDSESEFTKTAPRGLVLNYEIVIDSTSFGSNAPVAIVNVSGSSVISIENAKRSMFRLGSGGQSPDPNHSHAYGVNPENPLIATSNASPDPFAGGDWELLDFKAWMDAVMTEIKNIKGSAYWYSNGSSLVPGINLSDVFFDALSSVVTGVGKFEHDNTTPGLLTWTSDLFLKSIFGPLTYTVTAGSVTLADGDVAYVTLVRNQDFQPANDFTFLNGSPTVTGSLAVSGIVAGDWVKLVSDNVSKWVKVQSVAGNTITLVSNYLGTSATGKAVRAQGTYTMQSGSPSSITPSGNVYWLAKRDDNAVPAATVAGPGSSGATRTSDEATITTTSPHNLAVGATINIAGVSVSSFNGVGDIDTIPSPTTFTYYNPGPDVPAATAGNGTITVRAKIYLRALGELSQGEDRQIDDNTTLNILKFIGSESESDTTPPYTIVPNGLSPFTFSTADNLTKAISQITGNVNAIFTALNQPSYDETIDIVASSPGPNELVGPVPTGTNIQLPVNSRLSGSPQQFYVVGKGTLELFLNGQYLELNGTNGWTEVGSPASNSSHIIITQQLEVTDSLTFRLDATGGPGSGGGGGGGSGTLQDAYDNGNSISTTLGNPFTVGGAAAKVAQFNGDIGVTGVIDPKGITFIPQASTPLLTTDDGLWVDLSDNLMQSRNGQAPLNITQTILNGSGSSATLDNNTGFTLPKLTPVGIDSLGELDTIDVSNEASAISCSGIVRADILNAASGSVALSGILEDITTSAVFGNVLFVSKSGGVTNVKPTIGGGGFVSGDWVIKLGVISKNQGNPTLKDLLINISIVGQL